MFWFSLEAARRLRKKMEAINVICSPDMQGQPVVYRPDSLSDRVCECTDDAGVLDTVQGSGPPGLPGFLPFHPCHSLQRAASTHPCLCPPYFNFEENKKQNKQDTNLRFDHLLVFLSAYTFSSWRFTSLEESDCWQLVSLREEKCVLILWLGCCESSKAINLSAHEL